MEVWLAWLATFLTVDNGSFSRTEILEAGGRFLLTGSGNKAQNEYIYIQYRPGKSSGCFMIANGPEEIENYVFLGSHYYVRYEEHDGRVPAITLQMKSFVQQPFSVFV